MVESGKAAAYTPADNEYSAGDVAALPGGLRLQPSTAVANGCVLSGAFDGNEALFARSIETDENGEEYTVVETDVDVSVVRDFNTSEAGGQTTTLRARFHLYRPLQVQVTKLTTYTGDATASEGLISDKTTTEAAIGRPFRASVLITGGKRPYNPTVELPDGLKLEQVYQIVGTPTEEARTAVLPSLDDSSNSSSGAGTHNGNGNGNASTPAPATVAAETPFGDDDYQFGPGAGVNKFGRNATGNATSASLPETATAEFWRGFPGTETFGITVTDAHAAPGLSPPLVFRIGYDDCFRAEEPEENATAWRAGAGPNGRSCIAGGGDGSSSAAELAGDCVDKVPFDDIYECKCSSLSEQFQGPNCASDVRSSPSTAKASQGGTIAISVILVSDAGFRHICIAAVCVHPSARRSGGCRDAACRLGWQIPRDPPLHR